MNCRSCGESVDEKGNFCGSCGTEVMSQAQAVSASCAHKDPAGEQNQYDETGDHTIHQSSQSRIVKNDKLSKRKKTGIVYVLCVAILIIGALIGIQREQAASALFDGIGHLVENGDYIRAQSEIEGFLKQYSSTLVARKVKMLEPEVNIAVDIIRSTPVSIRFADIPNATVYTDQPLELTVLVTPSTAVVGNLTWSVSDTEIAVLEKGTIHGISVGNVVVEAKSDCGLAATIPLKIRLSPAELAYNEILLLVTNEHYMTAQEAIRDFFKVHSSSRATDKVKALEADVDAAVELIKRTPISITIAEIANPTVYSHLPFPLEVVVTPDTAILDSLIWSVSDPKVAQVENGVVRGLKGGDVIVSVKTDTGLTASISLKVRVLPESISLNRTSLELSVGAKSRLVATFLPMGSDDSLVWSISPIGLADVDTTGNVVASRVGEGTITATTANGLSVTCKLKVTEPSPITILELRYTIDSVGGVEWKFRIRNNTNKEIKYIYLEWKCYNGVGDLIRDRIDGKTYVRIRYTGPLGAKATTNTLRNSTKFYNSTFRNSIFTEVTVEYMDGKRESVGTYHKGLFP